MKRLITPGLALALGVTLVASKASAVPYASGVTKTGDDVSFILNQDAQLVEVVLNPGGAKVYPGTTAGPKSFNMAGYTSYEIIVSNNVPKAWSPYVTDQTSTSFNFPNGVAINKNPASTNFGKVYVSEGGGGTPAANLRTTSDGIYVIGADGSNLGFATGGLNWTVDGANWTAPWKISIGPDSHLYVTDYYNDLAYEFSDDLTGATQLIDDSNKTTSPSFQGVGSIHVEGTQAAGNRKIYLVNYNYDDTARKGLISYDLGANPSATTGDTGTQVIGPNMWHSYYPWDVARDGAGQWYLNTWRGAQNQAPAIIKFDGSLPSPISTFVWETDITTYYAARAVDVNEVAGIVAYPDNYDGYVYIFSTTSGGFIEKFAAGSSAQVGLRDLAFDAAGNIVTVDNGTEWARFWSPGGKTVAVTKSDGTFALLTGGVVSVFATDPAASETGPDTGTFTISRTQTNTDSIVSFTLLGTASAGDYTVSPASPVTILAGQFSTNITITPIDDTEREPTETVVLTLQPSEDYALGVTSATVTIADNDSALYWDGNGNATGAGSAPAGTWGSDNFWGTLAGGTGTPGAWIDWSVPTFSAGTDATGTFTVNVSGTQTTDGPSFEEGTVTLSGGTLLLTNRYNVKVASTAKGIINSVIDGPNGVTLDGPGTLVLGGANTYTNHTTINGGKLQLGAASTIPTGTGKGNVSVGGSGTLDLAGFNQTINGLAGTGIVTNYGVGDVTNILTIGNNNTASSFSGKIVNDINSGMYKIGWTKIGSGTFTFAGGSAHTYEGDTTITAGTVSLNGTTYFGLETGWLKLAGGNLQVTANMSGAFWNPLEMSGNTTLMASSGLTSGTRNMRFGNGLETAGPLTPPPVFTGGTLTLDRVATTGTGIFQVRFQRMGGATFSRPIVLGTGTIIMLCNDDYTPDAVISGLITGVGQINYTCYKTTASYAKTLVTNGENTYSGGSFLTGSYLGFGADSTGSPVTKGPIGTGSLTINNDPWLGMFAWDAPRTIGNAIVFSGLYEANALHLDGTNDLTFTGPVSLGVSNRTFAVDAGAAYFDGVGGKTYTFSGVISGGASGKTLTKAGPGKLVFSGDNTYTVATVVSGGTLLVNNTAGSGTGSGDVTVPSAEFPATLGGTGTIAGKVTVISGTIAAGQSAGPLTIGGGLDLNGSATDEWELAANSTSPGDYDQISLTGGTLTLGGNSELMIKFIGTATPPDLGVPFWQQPRQWKVIALSGGAGISENFSRISGTNDITAGTFTTTADGTGVTLVYTPSAVPPAGVTNMTIGLGPLAGQFTINHSGGSGTQFVLYRSFNADKRPLSSWDRVATNSASPGVFTIPIGSDPKAFYYIQSE
jgi:autotransporter-associated beta strand protein